MIFFEIVTVLANFVEITAGSIAIYLFLTKRKYISSVFNTLLSYTTQITLSELNGKLDSLNKLRITDPEHKLEILNLFHDILGQLKGHPMLKSQFSVLIDDIGKISDNKVKFTEQRKRALVSELREKIRHVGILIIDPVKE